MKSLILEENKKLVLEERPVPEMDNYKNILVRVISSGICGSDIQRGFSGEAYHYPLVMGHEFTGEVMESLSAAWKKGDRVVVYPLLPCYRCSSCQVGSYAQCSDYDYYGSRRDGGFAEYVTVPASNLIAIPDHVDSLHAAMTEPCAVALHGISKLGIQAGDSGLVIGGGPIGLMAAQWMKIQGCQTVYVADIEEKKLELAVELGLVPIHSGQTDLVEEMKRLTCGAGFTHVVEACGLPLTFRQAVLCGGMGSKILFMGNIRGSLVLEEHDVSHILRMEMTIFGTWNSKFAPSGHNDWTTVLQYMDKEMIVKPLISHILPLSKGPEIFSKIVNREEFTNKVIFDLREEC